MCGSTSHARKRGLLTRCCVMHNLSTIAQCVCAILPQSRRIAHTIAHITQFPIMSTVTQRVTRGCVCSSTRARRCVRGFAQVFHNVSKLHDKRVTNARNVQNAYIHVSNAFACVTTSFDDVCVRRVRRVDAHDHV